jgi:hypothetical protein
VKSPHASLIVFDHRVEVREISSGMFGKGLWLTIESPGGVHDWRLFQLIKNEVAGPEWEAVELYPSESRLCDGSDRFHLFAFQIKIPLGFTQRFVTEDPVPGSTQRSFATKPRDLRPGTERPHPRATLHYVHPKKED